MNITLNHKCTGIGNLGDGVSQIFNIARGVPSIRFNSIFINKPFYICQGVSFEYTQSPSPPSPVCIYTLNKAWIEMVQTKIQDIDCKSYIPGAANARPTGHFRPA
jgi:hypothetical protein